jgi:hypothetical protein
MSAAKVTPAPVPRIALTATEAAQALGVGLTTFKSAIAPELRVVRRGKCRLYPVRELERWLTEQAERPMVDQIEAS